jgi:uncharacterized protein
MSHAVRIRAGADSIIAEYSWGSGAGRCTMRLEAGDSGFVPAEGSLSQFITEHYWGYAAQPGAGCLEYEVRHPRWRVREARTAGFTGDAGLYYGGEFAPVLTAPPSSAFFADGSAVTVFRGTRIA